MSTGFRWLLVGTDGICRKSVAIDGLHWPSVEYAGYIYQYTLCITEVRQIPVASTDICGLGHITA